MTKAASATLLAPSDSRLKRLWAAIDRLPLAYAKITIRNGDVPRYDV